MKKQSGFTLIELLVVVTIIGILSGIAVVGMTSVRQKAQDTSHLAGMRDLQLSLEAYKSVNGRYPDAGTQGTNDYITGLAPSFISKLPVDNPQNATTGYHYEVSGDKRTYCVYVKRTVFKPTIQADMYSASCPNSWTVCKGTGVSALTDCSGIISS
jgi:prepilin-type N-terminal cleavage/methylation domain-containing protein